MKPKELKTKISHANPLTLSLNLYRAGIASPGKEEAPAAPEEPSSKKKGKKETKKAEAVYYSVCVKDNGCGMPHEDIPNMMGRVLSSTKYGMI